MFRLWTARLCVLYKKRDTMLSPYKDKNCNIDRVVIRSVGMVPCTDCKNLVRGESYFTTEEKRWSEIDHTYSCDKKGLVFKSAYIAHNNIEHCEHFDMYFEEFSRSGY